MNSPMNSASNDQAPALVLREPKKRLFKELGGVTHG